MYRNHEGYADPTVEAVMSLMMNEYRQKHGSRQKSAQGKPQKQSCVQDIHPETTPAAKPTTKLSDKVPAKVRRKIYVSTAYGRDVAGGTTANIRYAVNCCRRVIETGNMPICGYLLYPQMLSDSVPAERELARVFALMLLRICDEVWVFGPVSQSMKREIAEAERLNIKVEYMKAVTDADVADTTNAVTATAIDNTDDMTADRTAARTD